MIEAPPLETFNAWLSAIKYEQLLDSEKIRFVEIIPTFCQKSIASFRSEIHSCIGYKGNKEKNCSIIFF